MSPNTLIISIFSSFIGLIELSTPLVLHDKIQAAKLPTDCQLPHEGNEQVIAIGNGRTQIAENPEGYIWDQRVRQAELTTMSSVLCVDRLDEELDDDFDGDSIICVDEDREYNRSTYLGDSGITSLWIRFRHSSEVECIFE